MYNVKDYNLAEGGWYGDSYGLDGKVIDSGKVKSCIECHSTQDWPDWKFTGAMPHY